MRFWVGAAVYRCGSAFFLVAGFSPQICRLEFFRKLCSDATDSDLSPGQNDLVSVKSQTLSPMSTEHLHIDEESGSREGIRVFRLDGPLVLANLPNFQSKLRADSSQALILDFTAVPYIDSASIGALVGAHVNRQKEGRKLGLVGVNQRIRQAFEITRIESLLHFYDSVVEAEKAVA